MYKVIKKFRDIEDNNRLYNVGDEFPTADKSKERVAFLKSDKNKLGEPVIKFVRESKKK